jgi:hypothetical protein
MGACGVWLEGAWLDSWANSDSWIMGPADSDSPPIDLKTSVVVEWSPFEGVQIDGGLWVWLVLGTHTGDGQSSLNFNGYFFHASQPIALHWLLVKPDCQTWASLYHVTISNKCSLFDV